MIVKNEIELHKNSIDLINETFGMYSEVDKLDSVLADPILHIYPKEDTYNSEGELNGYIDSVFFDLHVYNTDNKTVWKKGYHDAIVPYGELDIRQIKVFKDLSTMIALKGKYNVIGGLALGLEKIE